MSSNAALAHSSPAIVQRAPRWDCDFDVVIGDDSGRELIGRVANISEGGFMAECEEKMRLGSVVQVNLPGRGTVSAEVRWSIGWRFGAMILED